MRSADPRVALRSIGCAALLGACSVAPGPAPAPAPAIEEPLPEPTHFLGESFQLAAAECQLVRAQPALTEPRLRPIGRPPEDIPVVIVELACQPVRAKGLALELRWLDDARREHRPSVRSALSEREPDLTVFEVDRAHAGVATPRRYDARTGDPRGQRERRLARLLVSDDERRVVVAPWPRRHDTALDVFLDRLARTLASGAPFDTLSDSEQGHAAIRDAAELYQRAVAESDQLVVAQLDGPRLTLTLERPGGAALTSLQFELTFADGEPRVLRALELEQSRLAVQCLADRAAVGALVEQLRPRPGDCNALGTLLPGSCPENDPELVRDALRVATQCALDPTLGLDTRAPAAPPDFELRLRRTRTFARIEHAPQYGLVVQRNGRVLFDGQQRVKARGAHEGRTSYQMIAALADRFARMGWFEREDGGTCHAADDRGDVLDVRMGGRARALRDRDGCRGGFTARELSLARRAIERAAGVEAWLDPLTPGTPRTTRDTEIWTVAAE